MPRLQVFDIDPVNVDADGLATSQTPASGGVQNLTLDGALASGGTYTAADGDSSPARQISITAVGNESARTFTVTGTDADGRTQTETITGPNATTTESTKYWLTVSTISVDDDTAGAVTVGVVDELSSKTYMLNRHSDVGALVHVDVTGTIDVTAQITLQGINGEETVSTDQESIKWVATGTSGLVNATSDVVGRLEAGANAVRFLVNSYTDTAEVQFRISQEG